MLPMYIFLCTLGGRHQDAEWKTFRCAQSRERTHRMSTTPAQRTPRDRAIRLTTVRSRQPVVSGPPIAHLRIRFHHGRHRPRAGPEDVRYRGAYSLNCVRVGTRRKGGRATTESVSSDLRIEGCMYSVHEYGVRATGYKYMF
jgi:hypothetical protein